MRTLKNVAAVVFVALTLYVAVFLWGILSTPQINRLALSPNLIDATTATGQQLLTDSTAKFSYQQLAPEFVPENRKNFCGVASIVIVINALLHPQPRINQDTLFTPETAAVKSELAVSFSGMTLDQLARMISAHGLRVTTTYASQSSLDLFRETIKSIASEPSTFLIVNYDRRVLGQVGTGHISPIGAYNSEKDMALVLDVAAHKYPYTWVPLAKLWSAINTNDSDSGKTRGYVLASTTTTPLSRS